jgi:type I restriction enzyme M protein
MQEIEKLEATLWEAADNLRANSHKSSSEYCMPVLGVIFLRHATNRYDAASREIAQDQAAGKMPRRPLNKSDFLKRRALMLPKEARYNELMRLPKGEDFGTALVEAMNAIEREFEPLVNQLPKEYGEFEPSVLENLLRIFDSENLRTAGGDVFGRIYEYFLMKFATQGAQDNGEFFTPPSLVQTIVNVIEPDHGIVFDPACGSGGMFVQSSHFIERQKQDTAHRVTFFGHEKIVTTIRLARMNLAVHGLQGDIRDANTLLRRPAPFARWQAALGPLRFRDGQSPVQRRRGGRGQSRQGPPLPLRPPRCQQGQEGLQRQLSLDLPVPQLSGVQRPRRFRHVVAGQQRGPRRG